MINNVLVVDDSETARMFVRRCLEAVGISDANFREAGDGVEALAAAKETQMDLIVTDLTMPNMGGEELLKEVKNDAVLKNALVLVVTSAGNKAKEDRLIEAGALAVISKPFAPADLYTIIQPYLG